MCTHGRLVMAAQLWLADADVENADVRLGRADATGREAAAFETVVMRHVLAHNGGSDASDQAGLCSSQPARIPGDDRRMDADRLRHSSPSKARAEKLSTSGAQKDWR